MAQNPAFPLTHRPWRLSRSAVYLLRKGGAIPHSGAAEPQMEPTQGSTGAGKESQVVSGWIRPAKASLEAHCNPDTKAWNCGYAVCSPESTCKLLILRRAKRHFPALWTRQQAGRDCAERLRLSGRAPFLFFLGVRLRLQRRGVASKNKLDW